MELIRIGEGKLKVMLTEEDMAHYALEFDLLDCGSAETRRAVFDILDTAKAEIGFEAARDKIYIQVFKGRAGGCELFVSCAQKDDAPCRLLYAFDSVSALTAVCRILRAGGFSGETTAYLGDDGRLFMLLETTGSETCPDALAFLAEYGQALTPRTAFLGEHAALLCENAAETLAPLA